MNKQLVDELLSTLPTTTDDDQWEVLQDKRSCTLYAAHDGIALTVAMVEAFKRKGQLLLARTHKTGTYALPIDTIFSVSVEEAASHERRAGFSA